jgi:hypothetical protein
LTPLISLLPSLRCLIFLPYSLSLNLWLGSSSLFFPRQISVLSLYFPPFYDIFPPYLEIRNATFNYLKKIRPSWATCQATICTLPSPVLHWNYWQSNRHAYKQAPQKQNYPRYLKMGWNCSTYTYWMCLSKQTVSNAYLLNALSVWHKISAFSYNIKLL